MTDHGSDNFFRVRPYLVTGGRTRSSVELSLETQVRSTAAGQEALSGHLRAELAHIVNQCAQPISVVEISAHLSIHLQVTKILVGDLITLGYVSTGSTNPTPTQRPDLQLLEKVLDGLQSL